MKLLAGGGMVVLLAAVIGGGIYSERPDPLIAKGRAASQFLLDAHDPKKLAEACEAVKASDKRQLEIARATNGSAIASASLFFCTLADLEAGKS